MDNRIEIYKGADGWMAQFMGAQAVEIRRLFGTDTLPTAYTERAPADIVWGALAEQNPGQSITYGSDV